MIYAIDPGSAESAMVAFTGKSIAWACIKPNTELLEMIRSQESALALNGQTVHIELIGHYGKGMPAGRDVFDTCIYIGELKEACRAQGAATNLVLRATIKTHICGSPKAKDANVKQALRDKWGDKGTMKNPGFFFGFRDDMWQAFALANYAMNL